MSKTALATAEGNFICSDKIKSLNDKLAKYSSLLAKTSF